MSVVLVAFLLLTFAVTWTAWIVPAMWAPAGNGAVFGPGGAIFLLGVFAPGLVALALTAKHEGRAGVARLFGRRLVTGAWPAFGDTPVILMFGAILISTWTQAGEELGWRGYALPRLAQSLGLGGASVAIGVNWAVWRRDAGRDGSMVVPWLCGGLGEHGHHTRDRRYPSDPHARGAPDFAVTGPPAFRETLAP